MRTTYHPQTDRQSERTIQTLKDMLRAVEVGDKVILEVSSWKDVVHFGKKDMLAPRYEYWTDVNMHVPLEEIKFCARKFGKLHCASVRLAKRLTEDTYDDFFDCFQQFEKLVNASRAKKLEKSHDPLALVAHTGSSSRTTSPYYVTHPSLVVDYDDDYQGDVVQNNSEDPLTSVMILLAREITQLFSNPTNNRLRTSFNTRNQAIVQGDRVNIQSRNPGNNGRNTRRSYFQEEVIEGNNVQNNDGNIQRTLRTTSSGTAANVQCYNCSEKGHYARNCPKPRVQDSKYFMEQMLLANEAKIQPININSDAGPSYDSAFLNEVQTPSTSYVNPLFAKDKQDQKYPTHPKIINNTIGDDQIDSNIIFDEPNVDVNSGSVANDNNVKASYALEQLALNAYKEAEKQQINVDKLQSQTVELQKTQTILKRKMSENKDKYHDTVLDLEAKVKENENVILKIGRSLQGMFMLGPKPVSFYDPNVKHGTLRTSFDDCTKSQKKMDNKFKDPIAIKKKQNNQDLLITISELKAKLKNVDKGLIDASSVRGQSSRDLSFKNSVLANTKKSSEKVEDSNRTNNKQDVASKNVDLNKKIVTDVDVQNALIVKDVLCVSCAKNMLIPCHDKCLANYKMNVHSKVRRALFTTPRTVKSKFKDTTPVASNTSDVEVSFRSKTCYVQNLERDDLLTGAHESNLLSHLNFGTINDLTKHDLVDGLMKFKFGKDHLCSAYERGKIKKSSHLPILVPSTNSKLELLHMDLCGPMRIASINGKKYILVIVDDYSRFTWVYFLHTKDETPEIIKKFNTQVHLNYDAKIYKIRTNNGTEFKNVTFKDHYEKLGIMQQFSTTRTPQQNGVVERRNRTLIEAARTLIIFSLLP
ncbi:retrovirus-related pol polyprotein from transposon TNT 1-94 [Tanacetum coccineum]